MNQKTIVALLALGLVVIAGILIYVATRGSNAPQPSNPPAPPETIVTNQNPTPTTPPVTPATKPAPVMVYTPPPATQPSVLKLLEGDMAKRLWIEEGSEYTLEDGLLTVHKAIPKNASFHCQIGGPHLDNYRASLEFRVTDPGTGKPRGANIQISPNNTTIFCQALYPFAAKIAYMDGSRFIDAAPGHDAQMNAKGWNSMSVEVAEGKVTLTVNADKCSARIPTGTQGNLGLLVNYGSDATVEVKNFELELLDPTTEQTKELGTKTVRGKPEE